MAFVRCPECGGTETLQAGEGWRRCDSTRFHNPRGPMDLFDGRRCGHVFFVATDEEDGAASRRERDVAQASDESAQELQAAFEAATKPGEIARLLKAASRELGRHAAVGPGTDLPQQVYRAAWSRLAGSGALEPTHDIVTVAFEKRPSGEDECNELRRQSAWDCDDARMIAYLDGQGLLWKAERSESEFRGPASGVAAYAVSVGTKCRLTSRGEERGPGGCRYVWQIAGGATPVRPGDPQVQASAFPSYAVGPVRRITEVEDSPSSQP